MSLFLQVELSACHSKIKQEISAREKVEAQVLEVYTSLRSLSTPKGGYMYIAGVTLIRLALTIVPKFRDLVFLCIFGNVLIDAL